MVQRIPREHWHLAQVNAIGAWRRTRGRGIVIAVIDQAVDVRHPEFAGRVVSGFDAETGAGHRPHGWHPHGTRCAGVALARGRHAMGIAPESQLMAIQVDALGSRTGTAEEAEAIRWAASHGADVILCAWGPSTPRDPRGRLPPRTRGAIEWAATQGRGGKGCVVVFSAGNGGIDIARNGYASYAKVVAVGACNQQRRRCAYSNWGAALWCVFPSGDPTMPEKLLLTTTPVGSFLRGETFYSYTVGHTSTAAAGVAGVCALVLSANPDLTWWQVKEVLRDSCTKIDRRGGAYDAAGHSPYYGYGQPDAARAVRLALARRRSFIALGRP